MKINETTKFNFSFMALLAGIAAIIGFAIIVGRQLETIDRMAEAIQDHTEMIEEMQDIVVSLDKKIDLHIQLRNGHD